MGTAKNKTKKAVITTDDDQPVVITNKVTIAMLKALSNQQRKRPDTYLDDLIKHQYLYLWNSNELLNHYYYDLLVWVVHGK